MSNDELKKTDSQFWEHFERWRPLFGEERKLAWTGSWLENQWCGECKYCCGPQGGDAPFPMALLPDQIGPENQRDFYMLNSDTAYIGAEGCKSSSPAGCKLPLDKKPLACGLFPLVLVNGRLYLYKNCPAVLGNPLAIFEDIGLKAAQMLSALPEKQLRHISIDLSNEILSRKYIDLHISLFDNDGICFQMD